MRKLTGVGLALVASIFVTIGASCATAYAQEGSPNNSQPNPDRWDQSWAPKFDGDRKWGSAVGVSVDSHGHIWVAERCGGNALGCVDSSVGPVVEIDASGKILKTFGAGLFVQPHGVFVDRQGDIWVTDVAVKDGKGAQVFKFSPDGKVLMTLGKAGIVGAGHDTFSQPSAVVVAANGDIFVADGHGGKSNNRIVKFDKNGNYLKEWGKTGSNPGEFSTPHSLTFDSQGRLFVADRSNNRIQIFDQEGNFLAEWKQFSRPSGVYIDKKDVMYVTDSESLEAGGSHPGWKRGIRIGNAKDGKVTAFIPDTEPNMEKVASSGAEGVAADSSGNIYAFGLIAQTLPGEKKFVKQ